MKPGCGHCSQRDDATASGARFGGSGFGPVSRLRGWPHTRRACHAISTASSPGTESGTRAFAAECPVVLQQAWPLLRWQLSGGQPLQSCKHGQKRQSPSLCDARLHSLLCETPPPASVTAGAMAALHHCHNGDVRSCGSRVAAPLYHRISSGRSGDVPGEHAQHWPGACQGRG